MSPPGGTEEEGSWLQLAARVAGLLAGLVTLVYLTGGAVMALRLAFKNLGWDNVVSQLPREFLISIGFGQVLLPALLAGALYGLFRLLRADRAKPPVLHRFRERDARLGTFVGYARTLAVLSIPPAAILGLRILGDGLGPRAPWVGAAGVAVLAIVAVAVHEARAVVLTRQRNGRGWNSLSAAISMAALYTVAVIPSMMAAAAGVPLTEAKVCTVNNFAEFGYLVGQTSDRIYLGEKGERRRIGVIPMARVEELFIGDEADGALCEFVSAPPSARERHELEKTYRRNEPRMHSLLTPGG